MICHTFVICKDMADFVQSFGGAIVEESNISPRVLFGMIPMWNNNRINQQHN